ncbi:hypothetical protein ANN_07718 [Periplaneta americana]|uniref:Endonuclease-reverse transcriptase n=1 Tax=Periplaneta americana TaxID=6978 RepID=A0ABQ8T0R7_PERAM|nr:hypothetical protein ANN_07718 [Periplaneta americana]
MVEGAGGGRGGGEAGEGKDESEKGNSIVPVATCRMRYYHKIAKNGHFLKFPSTLHLQALIFDEPVTAFASEQVETNNAETGQEEKKELAESMAKKDLRTEGCNGRSGERKKIMLMQVSGVEGNLFLACSYLEPVATLHSHGIAKVVRQHSLVEDDVCKHETSLKILHPINMGNACYYSVEKLLSSSLLSKNLKVRIYKTVILPVVLYGCETWTLTLREEQRLRVFKNKVRRKIFGAKRNEVTGEWRKLHNAQLHALYSSPDIIRNIKSSNLRWAGHVARMGESRNSYRVLVGRPEEKRPLGRPRRRLEDNIKMDLREVGYDGRDWINLAQDRDQWRAYVRAAVNLRTP